MLDPVCIPRSSLISVSEKETWLSLSLSLCGFEKFNFLVEEEGKDSVDTPRGSQLAVKRNLSLFEKEEGRERERGENECTRTCIFKKKTFRPNRSNNEKKRLS